MANDETRDMFLKIIARLQDDAMFAVEAQVKLKTIGPEEIELIDELKEDIMEDCETLADFIQFVCQKYHTIIKDSVYDKIN